MLVYFLVYLKVFSLVFYNQHRVKRLVSSISAGLNLFSELVLLLLGALFWVCLVHRIEYYYKFVTNHFQWYGIEGFIEFYGYTVYAG